MALSKDERDAMPAEYFAVPGKRELQIGDEKHTRLAWDMVDRTHGLSPDERREARRNILRRAKELGIDTSDWNTTAHASVVHFVEAMALNIPNDPHVNKLPFSGVLTRVGLASDHAPDGTGGKRTLITKEAANKACGSLLGMGVDFVAGLDGHDPQAKIGIITAAEVVGSDLAIRGFFYALDFPRLVQRIRAERARLGFSYEAQVIDVADRTADPWVIEKLVFTGAAVLQKSKAAYQSTSIAAATDQTSEGTTFMLDEATKKEIAETVAAALKPTTDALAAANSVSAKTAAIVEKVRPHAEAMHKLADKMEADGIGCHASRGHAHILHKMADHMMATAHLGRTPDVYDDTGWLHSSSASAAADKTGLDKLSDDVASLTTVVKDLTTKVAAGGTSASARAVPARKTLPASVSAAISKHQLEQDDDGKVDSSKLSEALGKAGLAPGKRISVINEFRLAGILKDAA